MGLKDLAKRQLIQKELETVDDEDESASDADGEDSSEDESASDLGPGALKKKKTLPKVGKSAGAPGFAGKLDEGGSMTKRANPLKLWAKWKGSEDSDN